GASSGGMGTGTEAAGAGGAGGCGGTGSAVDAAGGTDAGDGAMPIAAAGVAGAGGGGVRRAVLPDDDGPPIAGTNWAATAVSLESWRRISTTNMSRFISPSATWSRKANDAAVGPSPGPSLLAPMTAKFEEVTCSMSRPRPVGAAAWGVRNTSSRTKPVL